MVKRRGEGSQAASKTKAKSKRLKSDTNDTEIDDMIADDSSFTTVDDSASNDGIISALQKQVTSLNTEVSQQRETINQLKTKLDFVLSFLDIDCTKVPSIALNSSNNAPQQRQMKLSVLVPSVIGHQSCVIDQLP